MPVNIEKSWDLVRCYRSLTHWQTTEYSATQLVSSINHKLSHAIFFRYQSIKGVQYFLKEAHHAPKSIYASMQSKLNISHPKHTKKRFCVNRSSLNQTGGKLSYLWTYICWCHHMSHIVHICREIQHLQVWNWLCKRKMSIVDAKLRRVKFYVAHRVQRQQPVVECNRYNKGTFHCFVQTHFCK